MDEFNCTIRTHIRKPEDYKISNDTQYENSMVIKTELGDVILIIDKDVTLMTAMDLVKAVAAPIRQGVNKEIVNLTAFEPKSCL